MSFKLKYPGYIRRHYVIKNDRPFRTEYTGNYSAENKSVLRSQVPSYWFKEPRRPNVESSRYDELYQPSHLVTPFACNAARYCVNGSEAKIKKIKCQENKNFDLKFLRASTGETSGKVATNQFSVTHVAMKPQSDPLSNYPDSIRFSRHICHLQPFMETKKH